MATIKDTKKYRITKLNNDNTVTVLHPETESSLVKFPSSATGAKVLVSATKASNEVNGVVESSVTSTELGYLSGVTSAVQTQLNGKEPTIGLTASRAVVSDGNGKLAVSSTTSTELGYVHGVTSAIQTQLDGKVGYSAVSTTPSHGVALTKTAGSSVGLTVTPGAVAQNNTGLVTGDAVNTAIANAIAGVHQFDYVISTNAATTPKDVQWTKDGQTITGTLVAAAVTQYKIYLVPVDDALAGTYAEYITVKPDSNYAWEKIGTTAVDLSAYTTTAKLTGFTTSGRNFKLNAEDGTGNIYVTVPSDNTWRNIKVNNVEKKTTDTNTGSLDFATGSTNGTISVAGEEVAVAGLDTAAYAKSGGSVANGDTKLVSGGTVYTALQDYNPTGEVADDDAKAVSGNTVYDYLQAHYAEKQNITEGTFSAVQVNAAGQVTAGGQIVAYGTTANTLNIPTDLAVGGLFFELLS